MTDEHSIAKYTPKQTEKHQSSPKSKPNVHVSMQKTVQSIQNKIARYTVVRNKQVPKEL